MNRVRSARWLFNASKYDAKLSRRDKRKTEKEIA
jgi:hypothetical protein